MAGRIVIAACLLLAACRSGDDIRQPDARAPYGTPASTATNLRASLIIVIHGDGDYLYHDGEGRAYQADERALWQAQVLAARLRNAEVFIIHQKPRRNLLFLFPLNESECLYYRFGRLAFRQSYRRGDGPDHFETESNMLARVGYTFSTTDSVTRLFLYYGHEIPEFGGEGYDESFGDRRFTIEDLAQGMDQFTRNANGAPFDLVILSTCFNGTPGIVRTLAPFARFIVASPENLHLSYMPLAGLVGADAVRPADILPFARRFARKAFETLRDEIQTMVTVAVYNVAEARPYLDDHIPMYNSMISAARSHPDAVLMEHCDCGVLPEFKDIGDSTRVELFFRPPAFGRQKEKSTHSGWECWRRAQLRPLLQPQP